MPHEETYKAITSYLGYIHGSYNAVLIIFFLYQGMLGWKIRQARMSDHSLPVHTVKRHRKIGPFLAPFGIAGFFAGATIVYINEGRFLEHPVHFFVGLTLVCSIIATFSVSRKIKGTQSRWRTPHFMFGVLTLCLYIVQAYLGLSMLFS
jgi:uncharacterized membrane protein YozB (DUF420 family)